jgi:hypothetical protein
MGGLSIPTIVTEKLLNLYIALNGTDIVIPLPLLIHGHGISFHSLVSSLVSFIDAF